MKKNKLPFKASVQFMILSALFIIAMIFLANRLLLAIVIVLLVVWFYLIIKHNQFVGGRQLLTVNPLERKESHNVLAEKKIKTLEELPMGMIFFNPDNFDVIYSNQTAQLIFEQATDKVLVDVQQKKFIEQQLDIPLALPAVKKTCRIGDKWYSIEFNTEQGLMLFSEITEEIQFRKRATDRRVAIGTICIDNYDDSTDSLDVKRVSYLNSYFTTIISDWAAEYKVFFKKTSSDRYFFVLYYVDLERVMESKFALLDKVRVETNKQGIPLTLSIGVAYGNTNIADIAALSQTNLDVAQARGGDQVVIQENRKNAKPTYFGGRSSSPSRRNRVRSRAMSTALTKVMKRSTDIYVMGHRYPDMDAIGSAIGVARLADFQNKNAYIILDEEKLTQDVVRCLEEVRKYPDIAHRIITPEEAVDRKSENSLLVMVDYHRPSLSISAELYDQFQNIAVIDHHRRGEEFPDKPQLVYIEPSASSAGEQVTELIQYQSDNQKKLSAIEATVLLAGMTVDTKNFSIRTSSRTFDAAAYLKSCGADSILVQQLLREDLEDYLRINNLIIQAEYLHEDMVLASGKDQDFYDSITAAKTADTLLGMTGINSAFVITRRNDGLVGISARSFGKVNVQLVMEALGGGGHFTNAAVQFSDKSVEEVKKLLIKTIHEKMADIYHDEE